MESNSNVRRRNKMSPDERYTTDPLLRRVYSKREISVFEKVLLSRNQIKWQWAIVFLLFWLFLYYFIAVPAFHRKPKPLSIKNEADYPGRFIAERAEQNLRGLVALGPRVVGSKTNEQDAIKYFLNHLGKLKSEANVMYDIEIDIQQASGSYIFWKMINMYQGVQNVIVKISAKTSNSTSYLLVNSHYDSVPFGPGAGDDGSMVAIMMEVLRVISLSKIPLQHPVVFLFNGAEENPLQASHAFITKHKWAKNVKAVINLDSAGNGGREILFQSGPNHPWLVKAYSQAAMHPFASTLVEELFQRNLIPSDTDFRIFRDHGKIPGLDMAYLYNGYVYHTRFDVAEILPRGTLQNTGDNVLALVREIANSQELEDPSQYSQGNTVFFDILGVYLVYYSEKEGIILNSLSCLSAIVLCLWSIFMMSQKTGETLTNMLKKCWIALIVQVVGFVTGITLSFIIAISMDLLHLPMAWFTNSWLLFGLYFCPFFFGFTIVQSLYLQKTKNSRFPVSYRIQLLLHCHCLFLVLLTLILMACHIRSAYTLVLSVLLYTMGLIINLISKLHNQPFLWLIPHLISCIPNFLITAHVLHMTFTGFTPMLGRNGSNTNPELYMAAFSIALSTLLVGFILPVLNLFEKKKTIICSLLGITLVCIILSLTPLGFPYRPETNIQRFYVLHTARNLRDNNNNIRRSETGYLIFPQDRRTYSINDYIINKTLAENVITDCEKELMCGLPLYNHRWQKTRTSAIWVPGPAPRIEKLPNLKVNSIAVVNTKKRYNLELSGPDHMAIFIRPLENISISSWSLHHIPLRMNWTPPYFVYFSYGIDNMPLKFWIEFECETVSQTKENVFEVGVGGHWNHDANLYTADFKKFIKSFPNFVDVTAWPASYESWFY